MKNFRKLSIFIVVLCAFLFTACGNKNVDGTLEEIMTSVYASLSEDEKPMMLENVEITSENVGNYLGTNEIEFEEALASEPMVSSIAHSVVLLRVKDGDNVEEIKEVIKNNIDPWKWVCVGVEEDDVIIKSKGNLIIAIVVGDEQTREKLEKGFDEL